MQHSIHPLHIQILPWQVSRAAILTNTGVYTSIRSKTDLLSVFCHSRATGRRAAGSTPSSHMFPVHQRLTRRHITHLMLCQAQTCLQEGSSLHSWKFSPWVASRQGYSSCAAPQAARQAAAFSPSWSVCC